MVLSLCARDFIGGDCPAFLVDANAQGSGKTLLAKIAGVIATGENPSVTCWPIDAEEQRKKLMSLTSQIPSPGMIIWDNITTTISSTSVESYITAGGVYKDRLLGGNKVAAVSNATIQVFTGNGISCGDDMQRRSLRIRLSPRCEHPEDRQDFLIADLAKHVAENRRTLLTAAITILRGWVHAGRPDCGIKPLGSFEAFTSIRSAIVFAGLPDPCTVRTEMRQQSSGARAGLRALLQVMGERGLVFDVRVEDGRTAGQLLQDAAGDEAMAEALSNLTGMGFDALQKAGAAKLGMLLRAQIGRVVSLDGRDYELGFATKRANQKAWAFVSLDGFTVPMFKTG